MFSIFKSQMIYDYIIVGQGIAGTLLAHELIKKHQSVLVIDQKLEGASSSMAAGIINPITGRRMVKSWMFDKLLSVLQTTYADLEQLLSTNFFHPMHIVKLIKNPSEVDEFLIKNDDPAYSPYLDVDTEQHDYLNNSSFADTLIIRNAYHIQVDLLLNVFRDYLQERKLLVEDTFEPAQIEYSDDMILYQTYQSKRLIFCEGHRASNNPYFDHLPFVLAKGDLITIHCPGLPQDKIISKNFFILPIGNQRFKVGSTYEWTFDHALPNDESKKQLAKKLDQLLALPYTILDHTSGIRPSTKDRRPFIGMHPGHSQLGIFNGFGTKAYSLVPYFAQHFTDHLLTNSPLLPEADILRFND